ncbi:hypothetical protein ABW21_db0203408 [Orbilia brochopaga]|nr:hypothetical protein ABW21_db0203408 [Drechslerella brochopaga]
MSATLQAENNLYELTAAQVTMTPERTKAAARIVMWGTRYGVLWKAPLVDLAQKYIESVKGSRTTNGYLGAAARTFREDEIGDLTRTFIKLFDVTMQERLTDEGEILPAETLWQITKDQNEAIPWADIEKRVRAIPQHRPDLDYVEGYFKIINTALAAARQSLSKELTAVLVREYLVTAAQDSGRTNINRLENLVTLANNIHSAWGSGLFMMEPLDTDNETPITVDLSRFAETAVPQSYSIKVRYLTAPTSPLYKASEGITHLSLDEVLVYEPDNDPTIWSKQVWNQNRLNQIEDGAVFTWSTKDPINSPLPHPHLLWLHGSLSRVVRLAGRGLEEQPMEWSSESEEEENMELEATAGHSSGLSNSPQYILSGDAGSTGEEGVRGSAMDLDDESKAGDEEDAESGVPRGGRRQSPD